MRIIIALLTLTISLALAKTHKGKHKHINQQGNCPSTISCSQIRSCDEAYHYLRDCGIKKLDKNRDGVPCEKLCR